MLHPGEGQLKINGFNTYYKIVGEPSEKIPLLVLHGGPGSSHNYLLPLQKLAEHGRQVVFYDQLGCGQSSHPDNPSLWQMSTFVGELKRLRQALNLDFIHLLGHSWGGMLAIEYLIAKPSGVASATLASSMISMPLFQSEAEKLKKQLPPDIWLAMKTHEATGTTDSPDYAQAYQEYTRRHIYRGDWPIELDGPDGSFGRSSYITMWGPSEAYASGNLRSWDRIDKLKDIKSPTLITSGRYDELTPHQAEITKANIPDSKQVIFENSAHMAHVEEAELYIDTLAKFLDSAEGKNQDHIH